MFRLVWGINSKRQHHCAFAQIVLLALLLIPLPISQAEELIGKRYHVSIPVPVVAALIQSEEQTPWGTARTEMFSGKDPDNEARYHFIHFQFVKTRRFDPSKLPYSIRYFLHHRKCTARKLTLTPILDAEGKAWPGSLGRKLCEW